MHMNPSGNTKLGMIILLTCKFDTWVMLSDAHTLLAYIDTSFYNMQLNIVNKFLYLDVMIIVLIFQ